MTDLADLLGPSSASSLERIQNVDPRSIVLAKHGQYSFEEAVEPLARLISLFRQLPLSSLEQFPEQQQATIRSLADSIYSVVREIIDFDFEAGDIKTRRQNLIKRLEELYQNVFSQFYPLVAYSVARTADISRLEIEQRAEIQRLRDEANLALEKQRDAQKEIERVLARLWPIEGLVSKLG